VPFRKERGKKIGSAQAYKDKSSYKGEYPGMKGSVPSCRGGTGTGGNAFLLWRGGKRSRLGYEKKRAAQGERGEEYNL